MEAMEAAEIIVFDYSDNMRPNMPRAFSRRARARITALAWSASSYREGFSTIAAVRLRAVLIRLRLAFVPERPVSRERTLRRVSTLISGILAALVLIFVPTSAVSQLSYNNNEAVAGTLLAAPLVNAYIPADILLFAPPLSQGSEQVTLTEPAYDEPDFASVDLSGEADVPESRILREESVITSGETGGVESRPASMATIDADNLSHSETAAAREADFAETAEADLAEAVEADFAQASEADFAQASEADFAQASGADFAQASEADFAQASGADFAQAPAGAYIWPAAGTLTSRFGYRKTSIGSSNHKGIDISGLYGDPIYAAGGGEVIVSGWSNSFGYVIHIQHDNDDVTLYSHCSKLLVSVGDSVDQGQEIARMGQTGIASGVHLHFELIVNGVNVDPLPQLP